MPTSGNNSDPSPSPVSPRGIMLMGVYLVVLAALLVIVLAALWPVKIAEDGKEVWNNQFVLFGRCLGDIPFETRLIFIVMTVGALGAYIHAATSFATYVGNQTLAASWIWWYLLRPLIGMALALLFYLILRGGMLSAGTPSEGLNPFGVAAVAGLVGMFSKQATDKLQEVADSLFRVGPGRGDDERKDKLKEGTPSPVPQVKAIVPSPFPKSRKNLGIEITGSGFVKTSKVRVDDNVREAKFIDAEHLTVLLLPEDTARAKLAVTVVNPKPGGGVSAPVELPIAQE